MRHWLARAGPRARVHSGVNDNPPNRQRLQWWAFKLDNNDNNSNLAGQYLRTGAELASDNKGCRLIVNYSIGSEADVLPMGGQRLAAPLIELAGPEICKHSRPAGRVQSAAQPVGISLAGRSLDPYFNEAGHRRGPTRMASLIPLVVVLSTLDFRRARGATLVAAKRSMDQ